MIPLASSLNKKLLIRIISGFESLVIKLDIVPINEMTNFLMNLLISSVLIVKSACEVRGLRSMSQDVFSLWEILS